MKKKILIFVIVAIVIAACVGLIYAGTILHGKETNEDKHLVEITFNELQEKANNKETFILLVSQTNCSHCLEFKPTFKKVLAKYDITAYNIELDKLNTEEKTKLKDIANVTSTPTTVFIDNGEEKSTSQRLVGTVTEDRVIKRLKALGYIKE